MKTKILKQAKRTLSLLLALLMVVPMTVSLAVPVSAAEVKYKVEDGYIYFDTSTGTITDCDTNVTKVEIPSTINRVRVKSIGNYAFSSCKYLESIIIPDSVTSIGEGAFSRCKSIKQINIPEGITSIADYTFSESSLRTLTIPDSVTHIGAEAFYFAGVNFLTLPAQSFSLGSDAFYASKIANINITDLVSWCNAYSFSFHFSGPHRQAYSWNLYLNGDLVTDLVIPDGVTAIPFTAFSNCSLKSITIPNGVTSIGNGAFYNCKKLESITIPDSVTSIGENAFYHCEQLKSIVIPSGVTVINDYTFDGCTGLQSITIPDGVTSIGDHAFYQCKSLTSIIIPNSVTSIGEYAFSHCDFLREVILGNSVTEVGRRAFYDCELRSVYIPNSLASVGENAFFTAVFIWDSRHVYYCGDDDSWNNISIDPSNNVLLNSYRSHNSSNWSIAIEPTCTDKGVEVSSCIYCENTTTRDVPIKPHTYGEWLITTKPTCTFEGIQTQYCVDCNATNTSTLRTNPNNHVFGDWVVISPSSATTQGFQIRKCTLCDVSENSYIPANSFIDVKDGQWYTEGILWCYQKGYMAGISSTEFGRKSNVTRAMFATILAKIDGGDIPEYTAEEMSFSDVSAGKWYSNAIEWASRNNYASGIGGGLFGRNNDVTRETLAQFFYTYSSLNDIDISDKADLSMFTDLGRVHSWALDAVEWAVAKGLISGTTETTLAPRDSATRAEIAIIIKNYVENVKG